VRGLRLHVFVTTGAIDPPRALLGGGSFDRVAVQVPVFLIEHPQAGGILVGTGLSPMLAEKARQHLGWLLAAVVEPDVQEGQDLVSQLTTAGLDPGAVRHVILGDGRFPQTGQIDRFVEAEVTLAAKERGWALEGAAPPGVRAADLVAVRRWAPVDFTGTPPLGTFEHSHDLLGDGSVVLLDVAGYTPGTVAVLVRLPEGPVVLGGGAVPFTRTLRTPVVPMVATDADAWWLSAWRVKRFRELAEGVTVVPGFEVADIAAADARPDIRIHRLAETQADQKTPDKRRDRPPDFPVADPPSMPPPLSG
jgi:N-acyl homoserine lactone hydrolase